MSEFKKGDRVYYSGPVINESWSSEYVATVMNAYGDRIDVKWDHGPSNSGHDANYFSLVF